MIDDCGVGVTLGGSCLHVRLVRIRLNDSGIEVGWFVRRLVFRMSSSLGFLTRNTFPLSRFAAEHFDGTPFTTSTDFYMFCSLRFADLARTSELEGARCLATCRLVGHNLSDWFLVVSIRP